MENEQIVMGALPSVPDMRDYVGKTSKDTFPNEFELSEMPAVKNQGYVGSCVAHALSTATEYFNEKETGKFTEMSTGYIYGNRLLSTHKGTGMYTRDAIKTLAKFGNVPSSHFPYNVEVPYAIEKFEDSADELEALGVNYKIESYFRLNTTEAIKAHLMDGNPVIFAMKWFDDIKIVDGVMVTEEKKSSKTGGHCMLIYGWNETGWMVQNSWGKLWGNGGKFVLPYSVSTTEVWGIKDAKSDSTLVIEPPFKTKFGKTCAKIVHNVISVFYNLWYKIVDKVGKK